MNTQTRRRGPHIMQRTSLEDKAMQNKKIIDALERAKSVKGLTLVNGITGAAMRKHPVDVELVEVRAYTLLVRQREVEVELSLFGVYLECGPQAALLPCGCIRLHMNHQAMMQAQLISPPPEQLASERIQLGKSALPELFPTPRSIHGVRTPEQGRAEAPDALLGYLSVQGHILNMTPKAILVSVVIGHGVRNKHCWFPVSAIYGSYQGNSRVCLLIAPWLAQQHELDGPATHDAQA
jgi:hypothetical protein